MLSALSPSLTFGPPARDLLRDPRGDCVTWYHRASLEESDDSIDQVINEQLGCEGPDKASWCPVTQPVLTAQEPAA